MIDEIRKIRQARQAADELLFTQQNRLRAKQAQLARARRRGKAGAGEVAATEREIAALEEAVARLRSTLQSLKGQLSGLVEKFVLPQSPQQLASQLDDSLPCLLFPMRMETRFMGAPGSRELWVRVYPDDVAVHTHEKSLTRDEALSGIDYWTARSIAASIEDPAEKERVEKGAWRALANSAGGTRASWIASEIERRALAKPENDDLSFLLIRPRASAILEDPQSTPAARRSALLAALGSPHPLIAAVRGDVIRLLDADAEIGDETRQAILRTIDEGTLEYLGFDTGDLQPE